MFLIFSILFLFSSCGSTDDQQRADAILDAVWYIEQGKCETAISTLEGVGRDLANFKYVEALASAYACKAGYSTVQLYDDFSNIDSSVSFIGGLTKFSHATLIQNPDVDARYQAIQEAIDILLYAGDLPSYIEPSSAERAAYFTTSELADLNSFLFYLATDQISRYAYYYGSTQGDGVKGSDPNTAVNCFFNYDHTIGITYDGNSITIGDALQNGLGACKTANSNTDPDGHADLGDNATITATQVKRMCQGVILMNVFLDTIASVSGAISGLDTTDIDKYKGYLNDSVAGLTNILNQTNCETNYAADITNLQIYFLLMYETLFK